MKKKKKLYLTQVFWSLIGAAPREVKCSGKDPLEPGASALLRMKKKKRHTHTYTHSTNRLLNSQEGGGEDNRAVTFALRGCVCASRLWPKGTYDLQTCTTAQEEKKKNAMTRQLVEK